MGSYLGTRGRANSSAAKIIPVGTRLKLLNDLLKTLGIDECRARKEKSQPPRAHLRRGSPSYKETEWGVAAADSVEEASARFFKLDIEQSAKYGCVDVNMHGHYGRDITMKKALAMPRPSLPWPGRAQILRQLRSEIAWQRIKLFAGWRCRYRRGGGSSFGIESGSCWGGSLKKSTLSRLRRVSLLRCLHLCFCHGFFEQIVE